MSVQEDFVIDRFAFLANRDLVYSSSVHSGLNLACSWTGQYVSICASGCIYVSNNYGVTYTLNTFTTNCMAICMSSSGQYQYSVTGGVSLSVRQSNNFGVTWTLISMSSTVTSPGTFTSCSIAASGQHILLVGADSAGTFLSKNFGVSFLPITGTNNITSCTSQDYNMSITTSGVVIGTSGNFYDPFFTIPGSGTGGKNGICWHPTDRFFVCVTPAGFARSVTITVNSAHILTATPEVFTLVKHCGTRIWARSATSIWSTINLGVTWELEYTGSPRCFSLAIDSSILYILTHNGDIITKRRLNTNSVYALGTVLKSFTSSIAFVNTSTTITGSSLLNIQPGVWSVTFGFKMTSSSNVGDGDNNIKYGLSYSGGTFDITSANRKYSMINGTPTTWESFTETLVLTITTPTNLYLNALINDTLTASNSASMSESYINATLIAISGLDGKRVFTA